MNRPSAPMLTDVTGAERDSLYRIGQSLTVLESWQLKTPRLRVLLTGGVTPRVTALLGSSLRTPGSGIATTSDIGHVQHLQTLLQREAGAEPLDVADFARNGQLFEIRPSALTDLRRATWTVAESADEVITDFTTYYNARGLRALITRPRLRTRVTEAQGRWERACDALVRVATQLPLQPVTSLPVGVTRAAAVWAQEAPVRRRAIL